MTQREHAPDCNKVQASKWADCTCEPPTRPEKERYADDLDDSLDPETEEILQFVACDMVTPRSPYRGSYHLTCALRSRIRTLIEEASERGFIEGQHALAEIMRPSR